MIWEIIKWRWQTKHQVFSKQSALNREFRYTQKLKQALKAQVDLKKEKEQNNVAMTLSLKKTVAISNEIHFETVMTKALKFLNVPYQS